jgi:hypothetical protein
MACKPYIFQISFTFLLRDARFVYSIYLMYSELLTICWCKKESAQTVHKFIASTAGCYFNPPLKYNTDTQDVYGFHIYIFFHKNSVHILKVETKISKKLVT